MRHILPKILLFIGSTFCALIPVFSQNIMGFDEAMELVKNKVNELDEYVMDVLFDILINEEGTELDDIEPSASIYNRS